MNASPKSARGQGGVSGSSTMANIQATDTITVVEGYDAMRILLETICRRHGEATDIALIIGGLKWADGAPVDPAIWQHWLAAVQVSCSGRR
jgi:hypothetical protein